MGRHDDPECRRRYDVLIAEWLSNCRCLIPAADQLSVTELLDAFVSHATIYYVKYGRPTNEVHEFKRVAGIILERYGPEPAGVGILVVGLLLGVRRPRLKQ